MFSSVDVSSLTMLYLVYLPTSELPIKCNSFYGYLCDPFPFFSLHHLSLIC
jgi:5'(3')-deoxyribonucleotidase